MAKRFMYVSIGVMCLVAAYQLGVERARAEWNASAPGQIVGGADDRWYTSAGECWYARPGGWTREATLDLPIPANEVKFFDTVTLISTSDVAWTWGGASWTEIGPFPGGPVSQEARSWGSTKGRFR